MIALTVTYVFRAGEEDRAIAHLAALTTASRTEPGNVMWVAHRSPTNPRQFFLYEQYRDQAALDAHRLTPHFAEHAVNGLYPIAESRVAELYTAIT
jgi:quinol monooxygenase YgiN